MHYGPGGERCDDGSGVVSAMGHTRRHGGDAHCAESRLYRKLSDIFPDGSHQRLLRFVSGTSQKPRVFHSGKGTGVEGDAAKVWRDMVVAISGKTLNQLAEANKTMYIKDGATKDGKGFDTTPTAKKFEQVLNRHYDPTRPDNQNKDRVQIREVRPWGAFFGVCNAGVTGPSTCRRTPRLPMIYLRSRRRRITTSTIRSSGPSRSRSRSRVNRFPSPVR